MDAKLHKSLNSAKEQENCIKNRKSIAKKILNTPIMFPLVQKKIWTIKATHVAVVLAPVSTKKMVKK